MGSAHDSDCDVLIVGAGIFGTSTAYHLAQTHRNASRITVLDRANAPSPQAASSDMNKIVRADYSKAFYMHLANEAMDLWWNNPIINQYFHPSGWVMLDEEKSDLAERIRQNFKQSGQDDTSADITLNEIRTAWGGALSDIGMEGYAKAYTNTSAGWADASLAVHAMMKDAISKGVRYEVGEAAELVYEQDRIIAVRTADGKVYTAEKILLCTGAWTPWLMTSLENQLGIAEENSIRKQIVAAGVCVVAYQLSQAEYTKYNKMPVLVYGGDGEVIPPNQDRFLKFTNSLTFTNNVQHPSGQTVSVPALDQGHIPQRLKEESLKIVRKRIKHLPDTARQPDYLRLCYDAVSPDQNQLICQHPDERLRNLYFATAGSFHSWKFLSNIGRYIVNVLNGKSNGPDKDDAWKWKTQWSERGAHESVLPKFDLGNFV